MKKFTLLAVFSIFIFAFTSCKKSDGDSPEDEEQPETTEYYITYKANGVAVTEAVVSATRGTIGSTRTLTITGTASNGANPKFKFFHKESFIGFVPGLSISSSEGTEDSQYIEYTNSAGLLHSTALDANGMTLGILEISYTNGGNVKGIFSGSIKAANGSVIAVTEGKFNVKFSN